MPLNCHQPRVCMTIVRRAVRTRGWMQVATRDGTPACKFAVTVDVVVQSVDIVWVMAGEFPFAYNIIRFLYLYLEIICRICWSLTPNDDYNGFVIFVLCWLQSGLVKLKQHIIISIFHFPSTPQPNLYKYLLFPLVLMANPLFFFRIIWLIKAAENQDKHLRRPHRTAYPRWRFVSSGLALTPPRHQLSSQPSELIMYRLLTVRAGWTTNRLCPAFVFRWGSVTFAGIQLENVSAT